MVERAIGLEYHDVVGHGGNPDDTGFGGSGAASYKLDRSLFEEHLLQISLGAGERSVSRVDRSTTTLRPVYFTFDDGGRSAHGEIAGLLESHGWAGHFMITTDYIGEPTFLSADEIVDLDTRGHVICAHSASHPPRMAALDFALIENEWKKSVGVLSDIVGRQVTSASVPGGLYTPKVAQAADAAGLRFLFTSEATTRVTRVGSCVVLGRYSMRRWTLAKTAAAIANGRGLPRMRQWTAGKSRKLLRTAGGPAYLHLRNFYWRRVASDESSKK